MRSQSTFLQRLDSSIIVQSIRQGLVSAIPVLMIGSFALVFKFLPVAAYQSFLQSFCGGLLVDIFTLLNQIAFGLLSLVMTVSISFHYVRHKTSHMVVQCSALFVSLGSYMLLTGLFFEGFTVASFGAQGMFTAIFCAIVSTAFFCHLALHERFQLRLYSVGADTNFNHAVSMILPSLVVLLSMLALNEIIARFFHAASFEQLFQNLSLALFSGIDSQFLRVLLFILMISLFWFFGIHGSNVLDGVAQNIFAAGATDAATGGVGAEILSKNFLDVFVLMGGCGTTLCLGLAILLFSRQKNNRNLAKLSLLPMVFNINELMLFGLPLVFNPSFLIPFILTPLLCMFIAFAAVSLGLVPVPTVPVEWVTPIIIGGYVSTGSVAGSLLQIFNVGVGTAVYGFFLRRYEHHTTKSIQRDLNTLVGQMQQAERDNQHLSLLDLPGNSGAISKMLAEDLRHVLKHPDTFRLYYQPQHNHKNICIGAEALLRWNHPRFGMIYPPLLIGVASETGLLVELEKSIFSIACADMLLLQERDALPEKISVNVTSATLQSETFFSFLTQLMDENPLLEHRLCVELTEQMSFAMNDTIDDHLAKLRARGVLFAIDDFSMGYTSLKYLQSNQFGLVKLDGSLIKDLLNNPRNQEIVASIIRMSKSMEFDIVAEYVETVPQRDMLMELGCYCYQGYLYSPAIPANDFAAYLTNQTSSASA